MKIELGCFQNRYGTAELSNKQLRIKQDRDILWQGKRWWWKGGDAFSEDSVLRRKSRMPAAHRHTLIFDSFTQI